MNHTNTIPAQELVGRLRNANLYIFGLDRDDLLFLNSLADSVEYVITSHGKQNGFDPNGLKAVVDNLVRHFAEIGFSQLKTPSGHVSATKVNANNSGHFPRIIQAIYQKGYESFAREFAKLYEKTTT